MPSPTDRKQQFNLCFSMMRDAHHGTIALRYSGSGDHIWMECLDSNGAFCMAGNPPKDVREMFPNVDHVGIASYLSVPQARLLAATLTAWADTQEEDR